MGHTVEVEIERNYAAFMDMIDELIVDHEGKYVLLHNQKPDGIYANAREAGQAGYIKYNDRPFSIQLVSKEPVDLGFYSYAANQG